MRGLDGNYINAQGDATARMQAAYQSEQNRQQIRAQLESSEALRKLREQVNETEKKNASSGLGEVKDDQGSGSQAFTREENFKGKDMSQEVAPGETKEMPETLSQAHIDIRV